MSRRRRIGLWEREGDGVWGQTFKSGAGLQWARGEGNFALFPRLLHLDRRVDTLLGVVGAVDGAKRAGAELADHGVAAAIEDIALPRQDARDLNHARHGLPRREAARQTRR